MAAALQALAASTRTRLGVGPRMKAHVDHGAWAGRRAASGDGDRVSSVRGFASSAHGYAEARDDGALASGDLVHDLLEQIEALGGPAPHPAVTIAAGCCESHQTALGCGATWALTIAALLVGAADRLHEDHDVPPLAAADAFQEASRIAAETARKLAIPAAALPAAFRPGVLSNAIREALALVDPRGVGANPIPGDGDDIIPGDGDGDDSVPGNFPRRLRGGDDAHAVASLAVGFDRERHPGDARLALAAALLLTRRLPDLDAPRAKTTDRAHPSVSDLFLDASRATTLAIPGPPTSASRVVPGVAFRVVRDHLPGRGRAMGGGSVPGDVPGDVPGLREAIRAWGRKPWRVVFVEGDVAPPPADRRELRVDAGASSESLVDDLRRLLEDRREWYAEDIAEGVRRAGGCDAFVCSGKCDPAVAAALARVAGVRVALCSVGRKSLFAAARLAGVRPTMDPTIVEAEDVATGAPGSGTHALRLETCADAGWDEDAGLDAARRRRDGLKPDESRTVFCATRWRDGSRRADDDDEGDRIPETSFCPVVTVLACAPVLEVAEARAAETRRALAKMAHAMDDAGGGVGEHFEFVEGGRRRLRECGWPEGADLTGIEDIEGAEGDVSDPTAPPARIPRGHAVPGGGALELVVAAAISDAASERAAVAASLQDEYDASAADGTHEKDPAREYGERHRALVAARGALCLEAFAGAFRDAHLVAAQNGGARFDDATIRATRAERVLAAWLRRGGERDEVMRAWAEARAALEGADEGAEGSAGGSPTRLDELRSRRQGIRTAMAVARLTLRSGATVTRVAKRPTAGR